LNKSFRRNRRAVSPVIATIIIVAVAIVMSIAVAYWMLGLAGTFTRYEKLEFTSAYATKGDQNFTITLTAKNTGTAPATINMISLNGIPLNNTISVSYAISGGSETPTNAGSLSISIDPGQSVTLEIYLPDGSRVSNTVITSGITVEVMVQTAAGNQYPKSVTLP